MENTCVVVIVRIHLILVVIMGLDKRQHSVAKGFARERARAQWRHPCSDHDEVEKTTHGHVRLYNNSMGLAITQQPLWILAHAHVVLNLVDGRSDALAGTTTDTTITYICSGGVHVGSREETFKTRRTKVRHANGTSLPLVEQSCVRSPLRASEIADVWPTRTNRSVGLRRAVQEQQIHVCELECVEVGENLASRERLAFSRIRNVANGRGCGVDTRRRHCCDEEALTWSTDKPTTHAHLVEVIKRRVDVVEPCVECRLDRVLSSCIVIPTRTKSHHRHFNSVSESECGNSCCARHRCYAWNDQNHHPQAACCEGHASWWWQATVT